MAEAEAAVEEAKAALESIDTERQRQIEVAAAEAAVEAAENIETVAEAAEEAAIEKLTEATASSCRDS